MQAVRHRRMQPQTEKSCCKMISFCSSLFAISLDSFQIFNDAAHSIELSGILIGNGYPEAVLQCHNKLDYIQRIGADIINDIGVHGDGFRIHLKLLCQCVSYILKNHFYLRCA